MGAVTFHPGGLRQRILLVTNDFPPRPGGIQSYLQEMVSRLAGSHEVTVYAPRWKGCERYDAAAEYQVVRHPTSLMLPGPGVRRRMVDLIRAQHADVVWFGAAAPLALLSSAAKAAGAAVTAASTHGHEVGWSMLPVARSALRQIGDSTDVITYVSRYTRGRFASAFGPRAALEYLPSGVDTNRFCPDPAAREELRERYGLGDRPTIVCVSRLVPRKGQDMLIEALPAIRERVDGAALVIVGGGPYAEPLRALANRFGVDEHVVFTGECRGRSFPPIMRWAMSSRCRAARAGQGSMSKVWESCSWRRRPAACRWWPEIPEARRKRCALVKQASSSTAGRCPPSPTRLSRSWWTRPAPRRWERRDALG